METNFNRDSEIAKVNDFAKTVERDLIKQLDAEVSSLKQKYESYISASETLAAKLNAAGLDLSQGKLDQGIGEVPSGGSDSLALIVFL